LEARALAELGAFFSTMPLWRMVPAGDNHPVLVLPGLAASDRSTRPLRAFLRDRGYGAHGWNQGNNFGSRPGVGERIQERLAELHARHGRKVSLIGWSLGGIFAREIARRVPEQVRCVITLGSPFAGEPRATNAWRLYEMLSGRKLGALPNRERMKTPP